MKVLFGDRLPMRRVLAVLMGLVLPLTAVTGSAVPAGAQTADVCGRVDIARLILAAPRTTHTDEFWKAWDSCQFRLYDDNDGETPDAPEVPHTFSDGDFFLGGILLWWTRDELESLGWTAKQGIQDMEKVGDRFYWGAIGETPVEIPLERTKYRVVRDPEYGWLVITHRYLVFEPDSLSPGIYEWRWEQSYEGEVWEWVGTVVVTDGQPGERANETSGSSTDQLARR